MRETCPLRMKKMDEVEARGGSVEVGFDFLLFFQYRLPWLPRSHPRAGVN